MASPGAATDLPEATIIETDAGDPSARLRLADGCLDVRVVEATVLARPRLVAAVLTGTLGRSRVYRSWRGTRSSG